MWSIISSYSTFCLSGIRARDPGSKFDSQPLVKAATRFMIHSFWSVIEWIVCSFIALSLCLSHSLLLFLTLSHSLLLFLTLYLTVSRSPSLSLTLSHTHTHSLSFSPSLTDTLTLSLSHSLLQTHSLYLSFSLSLSHSLLISLSLTHTLSLNGTNTLAQTHRPSILAKVQHVSFLRWSRKPGPMGLIKNLFLTIWKL